MKKILALFAVIIAISGNLEAIGSRNINELRIELLPNGRGVQMSEFVDLSDHPKNLGIGIKLRPPLGWEVKEGDRPHIVKKFTYGPSVFMVYMKEAPCFLSRNEFVEIIESGNQSLRNEMQSGLGSLYESVVLRSHDLLYIDHYPSYKMTMAAKLKGYEINVLHEIYLIWFEDIMVSFQTMRIDDDKYKYIDDYFLSVIRSVVFVDQYL